MLSACKFLCEFVVKVKPKQKHTHTHKKRDGSDMQKHICKTYADVQDPRTFSRVLSQVSELASDVFSSNSAPHNPPHPHRPQRPRYRELSYSL